MIPAEGRVVQVNVSPGGIPKMPVARARITFDRVEGDDWDDKTHHGGRRQAVLLVSLEVIKGLCAEGFALFPGALGENLTTEGLDFRTVRFGQVYGIGPEVQIVITKVRVPCRTIAVYGEGILRATYDEAVKLGNTDSARWGRSGFYARVAREGTVGPGDAIRLLGEQGEAERGISPEAECRGTHPEASGRKEIS